MFQLKNDPIASTKEFVGKCGVTSGKNYDNFVNEV